MSPTHEESQKRQFDKEQKRIYTIALQDVRRAIETLAPDDHLIGHIYRRLARAVSEAYGTVSPFADDDCPDWPSY